MKEIFKENPAIGLYCGIQKDGLLFCGFPASGYTLPDTPINRILIQADFDRWQK